MRGVAPLLLWQELPLQCTLARKLCGRVFSPVLGSGPEPQLASASGAYCPEAAVDGCQKALRAHQGEGQNVPSWQRGCILHTVLQVSATSTFLSDRLKMASASAPPYYIL